MPLLTFPSRQDVKMAKVETGMLIAIPEDDWTVFTEASQAELGDILLYLAAKVDLSKFKKNKRGPKKPRFFKGFCGAGPAGRFRPADPAVNQLCYAYESIG